MKKKPFEELRKFSKNKLNTPRNQAKLAVKLPSAFFSAKIEKKFTQFS